MANLLAFCNQEFRWNSYVSTRNQVLGWSI